MKLNKVVNLNISSSEIVLKKLEVLRLLGYENNNDDHVNDIILELIEKAKKLLQPKAAYTIISIDSEKEKGKIQVSNKIFNVDKIISAQLRKADYLVLFICSIGEKIEKLSSEMLKSNDMLEGYIMNLIGSEAAEAVADHAHNTIISEMNNLGLNVSNRFSPGYCNWSVEEQFKLFSFFPLNQCGISLTESALMNPVKSVSAIAGIGKEVTFKGYKCSICTDANCVYRRVK